MLIKLIYLPAWLVFVRSNKNIVVQQLACGRFAGLFLALQTLQI